MSADEKRTSILHTIAAWREARDASEPGSPQYRDFQRKLKEAEWELQALAPSQDSPGLVIKVVSSEKEEEGGVRWTMTSQRVQHGALADCKPGRRWMIR